MGKTIKQLADEIGVSKQAIQKRLIREPLCTTVQPYIEIVNGVKYIDVVGEDLIKTAFLKSKKTDVHTDVGIDKNGKSMDGMGVYTPIVEVLQNTIDTLKGQLEVKDRQIAVQQEQIERLQSELEVERQCNKESNDKLFSLTEQVGDSLRHLSIGQAADKTKQLADVMQQQDKPLNFWERITAKRAEKKARKENE